ncbi:MAG: DUF4013 domain-containing protein [Leptolyngbya sp.]|nr:DUF4013 domain-containing protein [Candidatus Melainabacteria bacterium]
MTDAVVIERDISFNPDRALRAFFNDPQWLFKTGVGGLLNAVSLILCACSHLFIPVAFILWGITTGYVLRAARMRNLDPDSKLPEWNNWLDLLVSGLSWMAVYTGQMLFFFSVLSVFMMVGFGTGMISANNPHYLQWALSGLYGLTVLAAFISISSSYLMVSLAEEESLSGAFAINVVIAKIAERPADFIFAWLVSGGVHIASLVLPTLTVVGFFFLPSAWFAGQLLGVSILAQVWSTVPRKVPLPVVPTPTKPKI